VCAIMRANHESLSAGEAAQKVAPCQSIKANMPNTQWLAQRVTRSPSSLEPARNMQMVMSVRSGGRQTTPSRIEK
jgi:hypothetical protein